ncbi:MAG: EamA family transporter [Rhodobacterales bacterium]|nr:EamA family transporter [Rhodobacterales bacterium]
MGRGRATATGFTAVLMWSALAVLTIGSDPVPPFLLNALCFGIGGLLGLAWTARRGWGVLRGTSWRVYAAGTLGLFGYHALYFTAFRLAPAAETGLIAYLWPLFIVLLSGLLPGERLRAGHVIGGAIAFVGAGLIVLGRPDGGAATPLGLVLAFGCAVTWAVYSVASRHFGAVPTEAVTVYCLATGVLSAIAHLALEQTVWPQDAAGWLAVLALGLGPVGAAFFAWDVGMKRGDIQLLGVASYAAPLLSTLVLVAAGVSGATWSLAAAAILIAGGAALAARASA